MTTYQQRIATLSGEDAPETKTRYCVTVDDCVYTVTAYDAYDAERLACRQWRAEHDVAPNTETPEAVARWIGREALK